MKKLLVVSLLSVAASVSSFAASVSYSSNFGSSTTTFSTVTPLSQFDPALGILTSITFFISGSSSGSVSVTNNSGFDDTYNVNIATTLKMRTPANLLLTQVTPVFNDPALSVPNGTTVTESNTSAVATNSSTIFSGFAPYTGLGTVNFNVLGTGSSTAAGSTPNVVTSTTSAIGFDRVTYNYNVPTGTPEPATMGLLGSALLGLGFLKFRTKKS